MYIYVKWEYIPQLWGQKTPEPEHTQHLPCVHPKPDTFLMKTLGVLC